MNKGIKVYIEKLVKFDIELIYMDTSKALYFKDSKEWHKWLSQNHDKEKEAWLIIQKKHSKKAGIRYGDSLEEALCFGWIDGKMMSIDKEEFVLRYSPRKSKSVWSQRNKGKVIELIAQGRITAAGLAKIDEAKKNGSWYAAYTSKIRHEIPFDLKEALMENPAAWKNFNGFANSYWNMYVGWVSGAKTDATRRKRIIEVVKRSVLNKKAGIE